MNALLCVTFGCILISLVQADVTETINVAVVESSSVDNAAKDKTLIQTNADNYIAGVLAQIKKDKKKAANIIVFPEYGLTGYTQDKSKAIKIDAKNSSSSDDLKYLNDIAKTQNVILVANLLEDDDDVYSTTVVLDGGKELLAKYRKINVNETEKNLKSAEEIVSFKHEKFGTIGLLSGDDILYEEPARTLKKNEVSTIIYTASMRSIAPFRTAISLQAGFAKAHGVNLVVASLNNPEKGISGSGIYKPCETVEEYIGADKNSRYIIGTIDAKPTSTCTKALFQGKSFSTSLSGTDNDLGTLLLYDYNGIQTKDVTANITDTELCDGSFCCKFTVKSKNWVKNEIYKLAVAGDQKVCALVSCSSSELKSCGNIGNTASTVLQDITITTSEGDSSFMPYILHQDLTPDSDMKIVKMSEDSDKGTTFEIDGVSNAIAIGIVAAQSGASSSQILATSVIAMSILMKYLL